MRVIVATDEDVSNIALGVLGGLLLQVAIEGIRTARETRSLVMLPKRICSIWWTLHALLADEGSVLLSRRQHPIAWCRRIEQKFGEASAFLYRQGNRVMLTDNLPGCRVCILNNKVADRTTFQVSGVLNNILLVGRKTSIDPRTGTG